MSHWIANNNDLKSLCDQLADSKLLALDTEFIRTDTYYPKIALIQLSDGNDCWLIDVLAIDQFSDLKRLIESPNNRIIFHACAEDLEVLDHSLNIQPTGIFDSQIAAGIANVGYSMGYARLVGELLDIELDKQETRSNWLARPLTQRQIDYAVVDVIHLHTLHAMLVEKLDQQNRMAWFDEEIKTLFGLVTHRKSSQNFFDKFKGAWRLDAQSLVTLKSLCLWRESTAKSKDVPKSRIAKDSVLMELAKQMPTNKHQLHSVRDWHPVAIKRYGDAVLNQVKDSCNEPPIPADEVPQPLSKAMTDVFATIRQKLIAVASEQNIPQEFLCNKRELEGILRSVENGGMVLPNRIEQGWRKHLVKPIIEAELKIK
jgi:ribonuclease D